LLEWLNSLPEVQAIVAGEFGGKRIIKQNLSQYRKLKFLFDGRHSGILVSHWSRPAGRERADPRRSDGRPRPTHSVPRCQTRNVPVGNRGGFHSARGRARSPLRAGRPRSPNANRIFHELRA
jgi:hypothetical protein